MKLIYKISVLFFIVIISCKNKEKNSPVISDKIELERIKLTDLTNKPVDMKNLLGKTLFINFWATWCKPCMEEMPSIQKAKDILKDENIVFLLASDETVEQIEQFKKGYDYSFNYVRVQNSEELNVMALPTTFIFNPDGKLVFNEMGYHQWDNKNNIDLIINIAKSK